MDQQSSDDELMEAAEQQDEPMASEEEKEQKSLLTPEVMLQNRPNLLVSGSPPNAVFSPVQSAFTVSSVAQSSVSSTMSNMMEVSRCAQLIQRAMQFKKNGNKQQFYTEFKSQTFLNGSTQPHNLRLWIKAFVDMLPQIIDGFKDLELVDLLLFTLPWLCHGKPSQAIVTPSSFDLSQKLQSQFTFGPSVVHGMEFKKLYPRLCFAVFPLNVQYVHRVINHLFSHLGIFSCEKGVCIGNWQQKNQPGTSPLTVSQIFNTRSLQETNKITKQNSQAALEELAQQCRQILKTGQPLTADDQAFLATLISFHPDKKEAGLIEIGQVHGQAAFVQDGEPISIKKCLIGVQNQYLKGCQEYAQAYLNDTQIVDIVNLMAKIARRYPFSQAEIYKNLIKTFPHQASNFDAIVVYQNVAYLLCEKLMRQSVKDSDFATPKNESSVSSVFKQAPKRNEPLKLALIFEQQLLSKVIDTIAKLDAEVKIRGRKGATFPSQQSLHPIQSQQEYEKEVNLRFYTEKEVKINFMMTDLLKYLRTKLKFFSKMQGADNIDQNFVEPLMTIFEERIFKQSKSNFVQYITLFICGHVNNQGISQNARNASKLFLEKVLSYLIRKAFTQNANEVQDLTSRMQAINYLGSMLSQTIAKVPDTIFLRCINLILDHQSLQHTQNEDQLSSSRIFQHCFIQNLALIFAARPVLIKLHDQTLHAKIFNLIFHKKWASLEYASPAILHQLISSLLESADFGKKTSDMAPKVLQLINTQSELLKGQKLVIYNKISRSLPFNAVFFPNILLMFRELTKESEVPCVMQEFTQKQQSQNIIKAPLSLVKNIIQEQFQAKEKKPTVAMMMGGSVTHMFRRTDKFTHDAIVRGQRAMSDDQQSIQSDQITISSPVDPHNFTSVPEMIEVKDVKSQQRRDIKKATMNITSDLQEQNRRIEAQLMFRKPSGKK